MRCLKIGGMNPSSYVNFDSRTFFWKVTYMLSMLMSLVQHISSLHVQLTPVRLRWCIFFLVGCILVGLGFFVRLKVSSLFFRDVREDFFFFFLAASLSLHLPKLFLMLICLTFVPLHIFLLNLLWIFSSILLHAPSFHVQEQLHYPFINYISKPPLMSPSFSLHGGDIVRI